MSMMGGAQARRAQLNREAVLSATPVRLLTMLYDRLLLDLNRAEAAQGRQDWQVASDNLLHAQAIVSELSTSLNVEAWDGGDGLFSLYTYASTAMMSANTHRDAARTRECIDLLEPLRLTWHEAAGMLPAQPVAAARVGGVLGIG
ncbi:MAG: flagellar protein FliS [Cryobacterium sp.]|nr:MULTISPECIES: flagellar export chaperone FliS [unclassified Cryobacterium]MCY7404491.1 flagellar protein FliS [Cryobacterium sp.]